jgi:hypothetical protein
MAVCFSGQPRHWKWCIDNIKHFFAPGTTQHYVKGEIQTDFFMHTWNVNTWRKPGKPRDFQPVDEQHNDYQAIVDQYEMKAARLEKFDEKKYVLAWDPMLYSMAQSLSLKRNYELQHDFEYDVVVKARLDTVYDPDTIFPFNDFVDQRSCYTSHTITKFPSEFNYWNFDDVLFYGHSNTMDIVGDIFRTTRSIYTSNYVDSLERQSDLDPAANWYGPGCMLYHYLTQVGIRPDYAHNAIRYKVARSTMIESNLNAMQNWADISRLGNEWYVQS